jgi:cytochrome b subunit of formate dehydrogenase
MRTFIRSVWVVWVLVAAPAVALAEETPAQPTPAAASQPSSAPAKAEKESGCLKCHRDIKLNERVSNPARHLVVDVAALQRSVHADIGCTDCHTQLASAAEDKPHQAKLGPPMGCASCHEEVTKTWQGSIHGKGFAKGERDVAMCGDCHGAHDIIKVKDPRSRVAKLRLPFTCAKCHRNPELAKQHGFSSEPAAQYMESIHGRGLLKQGLIVAPSCSDCHGWHDIQPPTDPRSPVSKARVPQTCGRCHVGVDRIYEQSIHGQLLAKGDKRGPVCIDCHTSHQIVVGKDGLFRLEADERCGKCHQDRLHRYRETYHGKANALGQRKVAACYDCHGSHDILPQSDPRSHLAAGNLIKTCQKCHTKATGKFAGYMTHADHLDKKNYPGLHLAYVLMTALLFGVFGFFGLHTLLWFVRSIALWLRDPKAFREAKQRVREDKGKNYVRFRPVDRFTHFLVIISFLLLVATGMPLKFYYTGWAHWMFRWMGGSDVAAALHRLGATITFIYFAIHIGSVVSSVWRHRTLFRTERGRFSIRKFLRYGFGPDSPMPNWQDVKDFWAHQKWFFGRGPRPQFDKWTYWEKFDYLAVFWGVFVIGLSGLIMWAPELMTRLLPGGAINVALMVHSDEALLAAGFIFTFHFFNVHFRVEKWPMDPVIFSGRISEEEMLHERKRYYDRLVAEGRLKETEVKDEWGHWKRIFNPIGMLAFTIGVALIIAIYWGMASRLLHG